MCRIVFQMGPDLRVLPHDVVVPEWVQDRESFDRWSESEEFPEEGRIDYLAGEIWIDMSGEHAYTHNQVKSAINSVLYLLVDTEVLGSYYHDGLQIRHPEADLSAIPDGVFIADASFDALRVQMVAGENDGMTAKGSPDMVLEVVSKSSVQKDTVRLKELYHRAGIREYWLVDARREPLSFTVFRYTPDGYKETKPRNGWVKSRAFGKSFRLTQSANRFGQPKYTLETRAK
jgi:Uma2 family endonuclease